MEREVHHRSNVLATLTGTETTDEVGMISYLFVLCMCACVWHWGDPGKYLMNRSHATY